MHTISQRSAEGVFARLALLALNLGELVVALVWHATLRLVIWQERARERRRLATLDDHLLRDIGLSRSAIERETRKPFWEG
jgi:uncharacterized protein YjiS (DUF1127 family)